VTTVGGSDSGWHLYEKERGLPTSISTDCFTCNGYLERRLRIVGPHLIRKADADSRPVALTLDDFLDAVHARHESGRSLLVCESCGRTPDEIEIFFLTDGLCVPCDLAASIRRFRDALIYGLGGAA